MFKVSCCLCLLIILSSSNALDSEKCKQKPKEKHCLIEWTVRNRWPHTVRWVFDWATAKCYEIRWSDHCQELPLAPGVNNWASEDICLDECSGWA